MPDLSTWIVFLSAAVALALAPGPGILYVLSRTAAGGTAAGVASACGTAVGGMVHVFAAALGVSAVLTASASAFAVVKWLGAVFLVLLGLKLFYSAGKGERLPPVMEGDPAPRAFGPAFCQGVVVETFNPKTALFFLSFIPQFVSPADGFVFGQFVLLGTIVVVLNAMSDFLLICFSKPLVSRWRSSRRFRPIQQLAAGGCLVGLGVYLAVSGSSKGVASAPFAP